MKWGGDWDLVFRVAVWGVAAGIVGARLYHDVTSWSEVPDKWWGPFAVWQGGLGVWGGIFLGVLVGAWIVRRSGQSIRLFMDAVAPGLLLAQGIGRIGNWFNQELFGKPTDLPVGVEIDPAHRPAGYFDHDTFHPTFLYELTYDVIGVAICCSSTSTSGSGGRRFSRSTLPTTASGGSSRSCFASIRRTSTTVCG